MNEIMQQIAGASLGAPIGDGSGGFESRYLFNRSFAGFAGHFPGHPILPAIVEILTVVSLAGEHAGARQRLVAVEDAKFLTPVGPDQELLVRCRPRAFKGKLLCEAQLSVADATSATMLIELALAEDQP